MAEKLVHVMSPPEPVEARYDDCDRPKRRGNMRPAGHGDVPGKVRQPPWRAVQDLVYRTVNAARRYTEMSIGSPMSWPRGGTYVRARRSDAREFAKMWCLNAAVALLRRPRAPKSSVWRPSERRKPPRAARIGREEKNGLRKLTVRGRPKGSTKAATALRDLQICRLLATGMSLRRVGKVFGISGQAVMKARNRQREHFLMRKREAREREQRVERRGRPSRADAERNKELIRQAALKVSGRKLPTERAIQQSMDRTGLRDVMRQAVHASQSADDEGEGPCDSRQVG